MHGHDTNAIRSRYDYYYSVSSPSLSRAANYFENQASLFGEPIATLLPPPIQKTPSPQRVQSPLTPYSIHNISTPSSATTNYINAAVHPPLIENFDNHLYESIKRNILDQKNNNNNISNVLSKHILSTQHSNSSSNSPSYEFIEDSGFESRKKRATTSFGHYKSDEDVSLGKYRNPSANSETRNINQISIESDSDISNVPSKPHNEITAEATSYCSSSKLYHSIGLSKISHKKPHDAKKFPFTMVKSKSDLNTLKAYPDSFTIISSSNLNRSPSDDYQDKRRKSNEEDDDSMMDFEWIKPPPDKLAAASAGEKYLGEPTYNPDHFGTHVSMPSSPILTDKIIVGSTHRVPPGSFHSHKKIAFAIINDYKNRRTRLLKHRHSDDNMSFSGRFSPYSRYVMQRELSAPALNQLESFESDEGEFYYFVDGETGQEESGRQTSIGFAYSKQLSSSMSNLSRNRPLSDLRRNDQRYMSTPNFIRINKRAVIRSSPMERINPRLVLHRSLKGVLKVYNNTNIRTNRTFSVDNMDIFLPNGKIDPNLLAPMPINVDEKRSIELQKHQVKAQKKRVFVMKRRRLSPIAGTPNKDPKEMETPKSKNDTPKARLEERLKKDKFGRLVTQKKASIPEFKSSKKKSSVTDKKISEDKGNVEGKDKDTKKAINFLQQIQARNVIGRSIKATIAARNQPSLSKEPSKQSIESLPKDKPPLKKKSSYTSLKSLTASIKTVTSFSRRSGSSVEVDEEAEAGDEITNLQNVKDSKAKVKSSLLAKSKALGMTTRLNSASSARSKKDAAIAPPSRTASKTSILSQSEVEKKETPTKSEVLRAPSASSIMSMTTAAITSNPLNTTLTITNQLAAQGSEIRAAGEMYPAENSAVVSQPDADSASLGSQNTISSQKTNTSKPGSRKTSAKSSVEPTTRSRKGSFIGAVSSINAIRYLRRQKSNDSVNSAKSDATQLTMGTGHGAENNDYSDPIAGKILEKSQQSLERVQKTVDKATSEIHQTINENLTNLKTLEKKLSKGNLLDLDANNNDVEKDSKKGLSRHSTKLDMAGSSKTVGVDQSSVNDISVAPDTQPSLQRQTSDESNKMNYSTSSSMNEMSRKRKICCGLSSCCGKPRSGSAQMIAGKSSTQPLTLGQKCGKCCCMPFRKISDIFKKRKVDTIDVMPNDFSKPPMWEQLFCCCNCCRRCKKNNDMEKIKQVEKMQHEGIQSNDITKSSCWSRMKCCKPCCSRMESSCLCSRCCRKKNDMSIDPLQAEGAKEKENSSPGTCTRIFCFCCLCCRKKPSEEMSMEVKRPSMTSQKKPSLYFRMCNAFMCCHKKKKVESRRTSMLSKKQSLAPTIPPPEEQKPKLEMALVEHASLMKGAIPVLPVCLAWFCLMCNIILPGTGTILSGFFCLCIGIPRFSQHDGARGRIGSFIINSIVGISQAFTIIFCLVGWGWSVWWGTIMLQLARRHERVKKAEMQRDLDEEMSVKSSLPGIQRAKSRDAEKGIK